VETEREVLAAAEAGLHAVVVNPTAPVGPGDWRPTPTGRVVRDTARGRMPATVDTGLNVIHVEDAARGHLRALEAGVSGRRYILGGENLTLEQIVRLSSQAAGRRPPRSRIPHAAAIAIAAVDEAVEGWALGREPAAPLDGALMARKRMWVRDARARAEIGHTSRPAADAIREAVEWFLGTRATEPAAGAAG
jgi:dihydroflavonol-4-reductase